MLLLLLLILSLFQVKIAELTVDVFRMMLSLEWQDPHVGLTEGPEPTRTLNAALTTTTTTTVAPTATSATMAIPTAPIATAATAPIAATALRSGCPLPPLPTGAAPASLPRDMGAARPGLLGRAGGGPSVGVSVDSSGHQGTLTAAAAADDETDGDVDGEGAVGAPGSRTRMGGRFTANTSTVDMGVLNAASANAASASGNEGMRGSPEDGQTLARINPPKTMLYRTTAPVLLATLHTHTLDVCGAGGIGGIGGGAPGSRAGPPSGAEAASDAGSPANCHPQDKERDGLVLVYLAAGSLGARMAALGQTGVHPPSSQPPQGGSHTAPSPLPQALLQGLCLSPPHLPPSPPPAPPSPASQSQQHQGTGQVVGAGCSRVADVVLVPEDLLPLTRHRLFLIVDSDVALTFARCVLGVHLFVGAACFAFACVREAWIFVVLCPLLPCILPIVTLWCFICAGAMHTTTLQHLETP